MKNSKKIRLIITICALMVLTIVNVLYFPMVGSQALGRYSEEMTESKEINTDLLQSLYQGALVMYYEQTLKSSEETIEPLELFVKKEMLNEEQRVGLEENFGYTYGNWERNFETYRYAIDYYATNGKISESNTTQDLTKLLPERTGVTNVLIDAVAKPYQDLWVMDFDELGQMTVRVIKTSDISENMLVKTLKQVENDWGLIGQIDNHVEFENPATVVNRVHDFTVVYGISEEYTGDGIMKDSVYYLTNFYAFIELYAGPAFFISVLVLAVLALVMTSPRIWKDIMPERIVSGQKKKWFLFEPAVFGICIFSGWYRWYCNAIYQVANRDLKSFSYVIEDIKWVSLLRYSDVIFLTFASFVVIYMIFTALCPVFYLGIKEYIRQYSFIYQIFPTMKKWWQKFKDEINQFNFEDDGTQLILKLMIGNFVIVAIMCCMWFVGAVLAVLYNVILFFMLENKYDKIVKDYQELRKGTRRIAEGDLNTIITEDIGVFEPLKEDLTQIRDGFKKAVDEEMKSQRMKTELITNVSHDLKTPLTAITTYVELLKKDDITEEERKEYVDTLDRKSQRLKVLIEDLFEVSKASSNNITLNLMNVDIVKLMKQVVVEHKEKYDEAGLQLHWRVPEEKVELLLDSQKTYRIFENLFSNIQKYAMPHSRVYIDVTHEDGQVSVVVKNMSAEPLNVVGEELTERFVRGDASRNTEGSGLGLAIAKNFTEAQKGSFEVCVDGDLFKTTLIWKK
ncbi:MAG: HAMP domain-containing histidine kinase [Roseburia sp.]|nr:HAMP domain-containing histidine kinase [Roseburia sp.]